MCIYYLAITLDLQVQAITLTSVLGRGRCAFFVEASFFWECVARKDGASSGRLAPSHSTMELVISSLCPGQCEFDFFAEQKFTPTGT
jgi:hypothetical protein